MNKKKLANLTNSMLEQLLSVDEALEFSATLEESQEAREFHFELCDTHSLLEEYFGKFNQSKC